MLGFWRAIAVRMTNSQSCASLTIRAAVPSDTAKLAALKLACFRETFGPEGFAIPYPPIDLARFEASSYGPDVVSAEIADPAHRTWVVVGGEGELVAYAHVGPTKLPHADVMPGDEELYQLYLRRSAQGGGLGKRLLDLTLDWLGRTGRPVWLGVWSGNARARHVYEGRGFQVVGEYQFAVGDWRDDEFIMRRMPAGDQRA